jgi:hypothetical protein
MDSAWGGDLSYSQGLSLYVPSTTEIRIYTKVTGGGCFFKDIIFYKLRVK